MLKKLENQPVLTIAELRMIHADKWFRYVIIEDAPIGRPNWEKKVRLLFVANTEEEIRSVPEEMRYEPDYHDEGIYWGVNVNPEPGYQIGGIEVEWLFAEDRWS